MLCTYVAHCLTIQSIKYQNAQIFSGVLTVDVLREEGAEKPQFGSAGVDCTVRMHDAQTANPSVLFALEIF